MFVPLCAQTRTLRVASDPVAVDHVRFVVVRSGGAILLSEFGVRHLNVGDVAMVTSNTLCGLEPEGSLTITTLCLDGDYLVDEAFWTFAAQFPHRQDAKRFLLERYAEPVQVVRVGQERVEELLAWLDELVALSVGGVAPSRFFRAQALVCLVLDVVVPHLTVTQVRVTRSQVVTTVPAVPRHRRRGPLREDARVVERMLREQLERRWSLGELAQAVHLSRSQLGRVFTAAFGKSPIAYLAMLRTEQMAQLLRAGDTPVAVIARRVGWRDADFATRQFRRSFGVTPSQYRTLRQHDGPPDLALPGRAGH